jgi:hypothetical protein
MSAIVTDVYSELKHVHHKNCCICNLLAVCILNAEVGILYSNFLIEMVSSSECEIIGCFVLYFVNSLTV